MYYKLLTFSITQCPRPARCSVLTIHTSEDTVPLNNFRLPSVLDKITRIYPTGSVKMFKSILYNFYNYILNIVFTYRGWLLLRSKKNVPETLISSPKTTTAIWNTREGSYPPWNLQTALRRPLDLSSCFRLLATFRQVWWVVDILRELIHCRYSERSHVLSTFGLKHCSLWI